MTTRLPVPPAPGTLEAFAKRFDPLFSQRSQRQAFCWWVAVGEGRTDDEDAAAPVTAGLVADGMTERDRNHGHRVPHCSVASRLSRGNIDAR